jgi:hypothetical protein
LLADRTSISIGVAKKQLVIEGVATDPRHPVLRNLADKLHRHHIGAFVFQRGVRTEEVVSMLRLIGAEPEKGATPLGLGDPDVLRQWTYVRLYPLTYEQLELVDEEEEEGDELGEDRARAARPAQLWIGLARAALASEEKEASPESAEPTAVARAINEHPAAKAYDQVIVGYLLQLAEELKQEGGTGSPAVRKRLSRLIGELDDKTLQRLIEMGGDLGQRKRFVLDASEALAADAVVELVQAAAATTEQSISNSMMRLLTKLSASAEQGTHTIQRQADSALREQVQLLLEDWSLESPNPDQYTRALESLAKRPRSVAATAATDHPPEPLRILQMAFEVEVVGVPFWRAVAEVMAERGLATLIELLDQAGEHNRVSVALWDHLGNVPRVRELLSAEDVDFQALGRLLDRIPQQVVGRALMDALVESPLRSIRRGVFERLASLDLHVLEPLVLERMTDDRWFIRRNMLALLNEKETVSEAVRPWPFARDPDPRVRREALHLWMRNPRERDRAVCIALADSDERTLRAAVLEAGRRRPDAAVSTIVKRLEEDLPLDLRAQLVRLLHGARAPEALDALLRVATRGRTLLFGRPRLAPSSPAMLAALGVLASTWSDEPRATPVLKRAASAQDAGVRAAAAGPKRPA